MKLFYKIFSIILLAQCTEKACSQDIHFSQFYEQPLLRNPALAGIFTGDIRFITSYRNQWQSVTDPYRTYCLSSEVKLPASFLGADDHFTLGLQLTNDIAGTSRFSKTQVLPTLNFHKSLSSEKNSYLSAALMGGFVQQRFDPTKLVLNDQFSANADGSFTIQPTSRQTFDNTNLTYADVSAGVSYSSEFSNGVDYYIGIGAFNLTKPKLFYAGNQIKLNPKFALNFGLSAPTSEANEFIFYGDYFKQGGHTTLQAGFMLGHDFVIEEDDRKGIRAGIFYRMNDAIMPVVQLELSKITIGVSYDANISKLVSASQYRGGFELTLSYRNFLNIRNSELQSTRCPQFGRAQSSSGYLGY
ncbi:PorP/SprF family type IX secretion system membrane protein [Ferruginibacter lapsinanis]|uniref:PorP/SprF family type IX secretion system membrane protein n=1 Tax=Ferruginibacter lapsinanis TaxID=563172 RepID=UPI001E3922EF|nr:PorP/SprF family type IX secretion system membrane protein [Ferruginibacter lapsinanis]UEG48635.1 PorP/SprF family type IX secretion system membrane protein [Ferruginibacter lapsinanis]